MLAAARGLASLRSAGPIAAALLLAACSGRRSGSAESRQSYLDFDTGAVNGTVTWNGSPITGLSTIWRVTSEPPAWTATVDPRGDYAVANAQPGSYVARLDPLNRCNQPPLASANVTVTAAVTTTANFDVTATVGRATGAIAANGVALPNATVDFSREIAGSTGGSGGAGGAGGAGGMGGNPAFPCSTGSTLTDGDGRFASLLPAGSYTATVRDSRSSFIGTFTFVVTAGQTTDSGVLDVPTGSVMGSLTWLDEPVTGPFPIALWVRDLGNRWSTNLSPGGQYALANVLAGDYTARVEMRDPCGSQLGLGTRSISVTAGALTTADFDVAATIGRVAGTATTNGLPMATVSVSFTRVGGTGGAGGADGGADGGAGGMGNPGPTSCLLGTISTDAAGHWEAMLPVGSYTARVVAAGGGLQGEVAFIVQGGTTTTVGTIEFPTGAVQGTIFWNGQPTTVPAVGRGMVIDPWLARVDPPGTYSVPYAPPGDTVASIRLAISCSPQPILTSRTISVVAGTTTTAHMDVTAALGKLSGSITANGIPLPIARVAYQTVPQGSGAGGMGGSAGSGNGGAGTGGRSGLPCSMGPSVTDSNGEFATLLPPGAYDATVATSSGGLLGAFSFAVLAGQTTDIDSVTTPAGAPVITELEGGTTTVGGLTLEFSEVTTGGNTTVVASGVGPAPPTGFQIAGGHYWDIDTTAVHSGPIEVCIHYDQADVVGDESLLRLLHDEGSGWVNITTSRDIVNNIICGVATSLSPFAVAEPLDAVGPAIAGVPGTIVAYATSTSGAAVSYGLPTAVDAVDGARPVSCAPAPGATFAPGKATVTCAATDLSGNTSSATFTVWVQYQAPGDGSFFLKPPRANGSSIFRIGKPVPIKFQLTGASKNITNLTARLVVSKISGAVHGTVEDESDEDGDDTDFVFKYRPGKKLYAYRWKTRGETQGTYRLRADLGDEVVHEVDVSLKPTRGGR